VSVSILLPVIESSFIIQDESRTMILPDEQYSHGTWKKQRLIRLNMRIGDIPLPDRHVDRVDDPNLRPSAPPHRRRHFQIRGHQPEKDTIHLVHRIGEIETSATILS